MSYAYSTDEELYYGNFETVEEAAAEAITSVNAGQRFWVGLCVPPPPPEIGCFSIDECMERTSDRDEYYGDWADNWYSATKEQTAEIEAIVEQAIGEWFDRHKLRPRFFNIDPASVIEFVANNGQANRVKP